MSTVTVWSELRQNSKLSRPFNKKKKKKKKGGNNSEKNSGEKSIIE